MWAQDATTSGATITSLARLDDQMVILPKLFRRLVDSLALGAGDLSLDGFLAFLASRRGSPAVGWNPATGWLAIAGRSSGRCQPAPDGRLRAAPTP
jgi:hypothetical protein